MKKTIVTAAAALLLTSVSAKADIWGSWIAGGTSCNANNVSAISNGDSLSVLFDEFGVNMPQAQFADGLQARKTCNFRIQLTPPNGFYLANMRQVYRGGIMKSANSSAALNIRYNIGAAVGRPMPITFPAGVAISAASPDSSFARTYTDRLLVYNCGQATTYGISMQLTAQRANTNQFLIGGLDTVDAQFTQRLELIPEWAACP